MLDHNVIETLKSHTPAYVFDIPALRARINDLRAALPERIRICYAVKANPFLVKELQDLVDGLEICSPGELRICEALGADQEKFVLSGVYKDPDLFSSRIRGKNTAGIYTAESLSQLRLLQEAASGAGCRVRVLLRLTAGSQFGMSEEELESVIAAASAWDALTFTGIQYFSGTQKTSVKKIKRELESVDLFLKKLYDIYNYAADMLEFGPGLAVSYFEADSYDEAAFLPQLKDALEKMEFSGQVTLELGRGIAASCGSYLTKVVDTKSNHAGNFAIVDGGMHQLVYFGQVMAMKHPHITIFPGHASGNRRKLCPEHASEGRLKVSSGQDPEPVKEWAICGALCSTNDLLVKKFPAAGLTTGDILVFERTGAYCMTEGIALFLSRDLPEVWLLREDGQLRMVRKRFETSSLNCPDYNLQ